MLKITPIFGPKTPKFGLHFVIKMAITILITFESEIAYCTAWYKHVISKNSIPSFI